MTMQAVEMVEAPGQIAERVSRLEGSSEQVSERLRDLTTQMEALRAELRLELATGLKAQAAATEALRAEMDRKFEAQRGAFRGADRSVAPRDRCGAEGAGGGNRSVAP